MMPHQICLYRIGEAWREVGPEGFSNETGGYPPGWCDSASAEELEAAWVVRVEVPDVPAGKVQTGRSIVDDGEGPSLVLALRDMTAEEVEALRGLRVSQIKAEARRRIEAIAPVAAQLNALRNVGTVDWTAIDAIRAASDAIEAALPEDAAGLTAFDADAANGWPA